MKPRFRSPIGLLLVLGLSACQKDSAAPDVDDDQGLAVSLSTSSISLGPGANGSITITITRVGGFSGTVTLSIEGSPPGVWTSVVPGSLSASTTATLLLAVTGKAVGNHSLTVRAKGSGVSDVTAGLSLTVLSASADAVSL